MECMQGVAHGLIGAAEGVRNGGSRLALGTGEEHLAAADGKGGRGPETGLQRGPLVRRERAYKERCLHMEEYTTCQKTSIGTALATHQLDMHLCTEFPYTFCRQYCPSHIVYR